MPYHPVKIELTETQARKALKGGAIRVRHEQIGKGMLVLHPLNKKKVEKNIVKGKAVILELSPGELAETALHHMQHNTGGSFWSKIWSGLKTGWKFLKDTGIATKLLDSAIPAAATALGAPELAVPIRAGVKSITGAKLSKEDKLEKLKASGLYLT